METEHGHAHECAHCPNPKRRSFLNGLFGVSLLAWLSTALYPVIRYLSPLQGASNADEAELDDKSKGDILRNGFSIVAFGAARVLVLRDGKGTLRATSAKCTHEGCTVQYKADESIIWCACHNGRYDLDGRVLSGPPPRALAVYRASGSLDGKVIIRPETAA